MGVIGPVRSDEEKLEDWRRRTPLMFTLALFLAKHMPRGKGWFPRKIGSLFCRNMKTAIQTRNGALLAVDPSSLDTYTSIIVRDSSWEPHVLSASIKALRPGHVFFDVGANVGYMSVEIAALFDDNVTVIAFEPQPSLARSIALSARLNGFHNLSSYQLMLGDNEGISDLFIPAHSIHASAVSRARRAKHISPMITTIDTLVERGIVPPPNVMKVDVEGGEMAVFRGARNTIHAYHPTIVFEADANMERFAYTRDDLIEYLQNLSSYTFFDIRGEEEFVPLERKAGFQPRENILALAPGKEP